MNNTTDLAAIRARAEAATYCGGDMQELADDALALLAEVERLTRTIARARAALLMVAPDHITPIGARTVHRALEGTDS